MAHGGEQSPSSVRVHARRVEAERASEDRPRGGQPERRGRPSSPAERPARAGVPVRGAGPGGAAGAEGAGGGRPVVSGGHRRGRSPGQVRLSADDAAKRTGSTVKSVEADRLLFSATDLSNYLACPHHAALDRAVQVDGLGRPPWFDDPALEVLQRRGEEHERPRAARAAAAGDAPAGLRRLRPRAPARRRPHHAAGAGALPGPDLEAAPRPLRLHLRGLLRRAAAAAGGRGAGAAGRG